MTTSIAESSRSISPKEVEMVTPQGILKHDMRPSYFIPIYIVITSEIGLEID